MRLTDSYLADVRRNIFAPPERKERFLNDLRAHIQESVASGESEAAVIGKLGKAEDVAAEFMSGIELKPAGFWIRFVAFWLDMSFCFFVPSLLAVLMVGVCPLRGPLLIGGGPTCTLTMGEPRQWMLVGLMTVAVLAFGVFLLVYFPVSEGLYGTTLGKRLLKLRVVKENGTAIQFGSAFIRRLSFYFEILFVDALFIPFTAKKQRAFDIVAKTLVIREPYLRTPGWLVLLVIAVFLVSAMLHAWMLWRIAMTLFGVA